MVPQISQFSMSILDSLYILFSPCSICIPIYKIVMIIKKIQAFRHLIVIRDRKMSTEDL